MFQRKSKTRMRGIAAALRENQEKAALQKEDLHAEQKAIKTNSVEHAEIQEHKEFEFKKHSDLAQEKSLTQALISFLMTDKAYFKKHLVSNKKSLESLIRLDISFSTLKEIGLTNSNWIERFARMISENSSIIELHFGGIPIIDDEMKALAAALKVNKTIKWLNLYNINLSNEGMKYLSEMLKINKTITKIWITSNDTIGDDAMFYFSEALKNNQSIREIDLQRNMIGDKGARKIIDALKINRSIISINLPHNTDISWQEEISFETDCNIYDFLKENKTFQDNAFQNYRKYLPGCLTSLTGISKDVTSIIKDYAIDESDKLNYNEKSLETDSIKIESLLSQGFFDKPKMPLPSQETQRNPVARIIDTFRKITK